MFLKAMKRKHGQLIKWTNNILDTQWSLELEHFVLPL